MEQLGIIKNSFLLLMMVLFFACNKQKTNQIHNDTNFISTNIIVPRFNADSAYLYIQKQVDFGPRVPNTPAHVQCADYLVQSFIFSLILAVFLVSDRAANCRADCTTNKRRFRITANSLTS